MGILFRSFRITGLLLVATSYSIVPIFEVPAGRMTFWVRIALLTSWGDSPRA